MPNKKKSSKKQAGFSADTKSGNASKKKEANANTGKEGEERPRGAPRGAFTKAQLSSLILVSMGASRLLEVGIAVAKGFAEEENGESSMEIMPILNATAKCQEWLSEETCIDPAINALLLYKYYSGIQVILFVVATLLQCWNTEPLLACATYLLILSPVATSTAALHLSKPWFARTDKLWHETFMASVMFAVSMPMPITIDSIPFVGHRRRGQSLKTFQSLCFSTLFFFHLKEMVQLLSPLVTAAYNKEEGFIMDSLTIETPKSSAASVLVMFLAIDKLTMALMFAFCWYYLPGRNQQKLLLSVATMNALAWYFHWPPLMNHIKDMDFKQSVSMTISFVCGVAYISPAISFKKKRS